MLFPTSAKSAHDKATLEYTIEDIYAGVATAEDVYGTFDRESVPEIIGYDYAIAQNHVKRLYEDENTDLNKYVFLNVDGSKTIYIYDHPVKFVNEFGKIRNISFATTGGIENGKYKLIANSNEKNDKADKIADFQKVCDADYSSFIPNYPEILTTSSGYTIADGTYYLNNRYCGDFLLYSIVSVGAKSGLISILGDSIKWNISSVNGGYVIRSAADNTRYLSVPSSSSSSTVSIEQIQSGSTIPTRCIWKFDSAGGVGGGCYIKNTYNNRYLYSYGDYVYTSADIGSTNSTDQHSRAWRVAGVSYYTDTDGSPARELSLYSSISNMNISIGKTSKPSVKKTYSNEVWCTPSDFKYSTYSSIVSFDTWSGEATAKTVGQTTLIATHKVTDQRYIFSINVLPLLIYQSAETLYNDEHGNPANDLQYSDMSKTELLASNVSWGDDFNLSVEEHRDRWENMCTTLFAMGDLETVILDMIDHFMEGYGGIYTNATLTQAVLNHNSTKEYVDATKVQLDALLNEYDNNILALEYFAESRENNPLRNAFKDNNIPQPSYDSTLDKLQGLTICIDSLWGNKIEIISFDCSNNIRTYKLRFTFYDHFGLDLADVQNHQLGGFRSWYILQHYSLYRGAYKPFITLIEFDVTK